MAFTKIEEGDLTNKGVVGLPDTPNLGTTDMQKKFDEIATDVIVPKHNGLIDELEASTAAASIGAVDANGNLSTVQAELNGIKQQGYTKAEADVLFAGKVDKEAGKGLSEYDFSQAYKDKLNGIEDNANKYVLPAGSQTSLGGVMGDGTTFTIDANGYGHAIGGGGGGTADYNALINKPEIDGVELIGSKTSGDFGLLKPHLTVTTEAGSTVTITKGATTITATQVPGSTTQWEVNPTDYGTWTVTSTLSGADTASSTITIDAVKQYSITVNHITATITVTYPAGASYCTCSKGSTTYTATSNPQAFTVRSLGTWTIETELNGVVKTATATISADGDSQSVTIEYAEIDVTYDSAFEGATITCTDGVTTYTKTAPVGGSTLSFTIATTGTWTVSATVGGDPYSYTVVVSSFTTYSVTMAVFHATVTVTFPYSEGATCSLSDGVTTLNATTSPMAFAVPNAATWVATVSLDGATKTDSAVISADGDTASLTIEYGTINLTYANEFRGQSVTCTDGNTTITKTAPSGSNSLTFYPDATGSWTISATYSGVPYSSSVTVVSLSTPVSAILETVPDGRTVTPTDSVVKWLACAQISGVAYTTLSQVLGDAETYETLLSNSNACDYMARSTTWSTDICADSDAMMRLGKYDYACDALLSNSTWCSAICGSAYFESVLDVKVPTMTSDTTPSGTAFASTNNTYAYRAFDGNIFGSWDYTFSFDGGDTFGSAHFGYDFGTPVRITKFVLDAYDGRTGTYKICGSNDNSTWVDLTTTLDATTGTSITQSGWTSLRSTVTITDNGNYRYYALFALSSQAGGTTTPDYFNTLELQFYGRHTAQTGIIHSAPLSNVYYMENGSPVTLCTTDSDGIGVITGGYSALTAGNYTLYSSVAKDPSNLSNDYSKTLAINANTTELWLMPYNGVIYWYGLDIIPTTFYTATNIGTKLSNYVYTVSNPVQTTNLYTTNPIDVTDYDYLKIISIDEGGSTNVKELQATDGVPNSFNMGTYIALSYTATLKLDSLDISSLTGNKYLDAYIQPGTSGDKTNKLYAMWLE